MTVIDWSREPFSTVANYPWQSLSWAQLGLAAAGSYVAYSICSLVYNYWRHSRSPLRKLAGPREGASWISGNVRKMFEGESMQLQEKWVETYGDTFAIRGMMGKYQLVTTDTRATTHILFASQVFHKPEIQRRGIKKLVGEGILYTEGEQHRDHRRILNPAFGHAHVREMTELFLETSAKMREIWYNKCIDAGGSVTLNALDWLSRATLDAIGKAGFDYEFNTLNEEGEKNELAVAFDKIFRVDVAPKLQIRGFIYNQFPLLRKFFPDQRTREMDHSRKTMDEIGMRIVQEKKQAVLSELSGVTRVEKKAIGGKDLISLLLQANLAQDLDPAQRLSDEEVLAQIPTFLLAGHETTSNSTTWAMYALAAHPEIQKKLREELFSVNTDTPTLEMLNALPYLDKITREVLRFHAVVTFITREAVQDDIIPLGKPLKDLDGNLVSQIRVQKGDQVQVPIWLINRNKAIWGPDANVFRPERWDNVPQEASSIPGISPNLMSFIGGPRSCVGHRFAVAEMKALLFHIVRGFEFRFAVDKSELWARTGTLMRPQSRKDNAVTLPVVLTPVA
ncbi:cytochrome P450 [Auricularia subglabra TFB-10046 SS5]|nr:cytochrome P450 [Auricularia subglabra TFB-10046 SS5]